MRSLAGSAVASTGCDESAPGNWVFEAGFWESDTALG